MTTYGPRIQPRDDLFWFKKPEFLLWLIHFVLFQVHIYSSGNLSVWKQLRDEHKLTHVFGLIIVQNAFELASFFWFWVSFLSSLSLQTNYVYVVRGLACDHFKVIITHPLTLLQWQFGYDSCFIKNHLLVYCRLILGYASQNTTY